MSPLYAAEIACTPVVVSVATQLAALLLTVPEHRIPCAELNVTVPVGAVLFTTLEGVTVALTVTVPPAATVVAEALTVTVVVAVVVLAAVFTVGDVLGLKVESPEYTAENACAVLLLNTVLAMLADALLTGSVCTNAASS